MKIVRNGVWKMAQRTGTADREGHSRVMANTEKTLKDCRGGRVVGSPARLSVGVQVGVQFSVQSTLLFLPQRV